jgi:hypothetical protein
LNQPPLNINHMVTINFILIENLVKGLFRE